MVVIGIAGGTGSGKTTVVRKIRSRLVREKVSFISQDSYYRDNSHIPVEKRKYINFDHPDAIEFELLTEHLIQLKKGEPVQQPTYSYLSCTRQEKTILVEPGPVVIVEGILIFTYQPLIEQLDIKVFIDADADDRLSRVIQRDMNERGRTAAEVLSRYEKTVKPMHLQFIEPSKRNADIIIPQGGMNEAGIEILWNTIEKHLG